MTLCWQCGEWDFRKVAAQLKAGDAEIWRAWHSLEPRGDERADILTAFMAQFKIGDPEKGTREIVQMIRDMWTPKTKAEKLRRRKARKKKRNERMALQAQAAKALHGAKRGKRNR